MNRRDWLRTACGMSALPGVLAASGCRRREEPDVPATVPPVPAQPAAVRAWRTALDAGTLTGAAILGAATERIRRFDRKGPELRAILEINPDAAAIASECDREIAGGKRRGPLHGIPVLLKGNIATADGMQTDAGSLALRESRPAADAPLVARLRTAGAVIAAKANLSEWANYRGERSRSGWSAAGGQCRNPHNPACSPGGSSSGCGAAVAAGYFALAVGTETDGSIVNPASTCGIAGLKPTRGLISRRGIIPIAHSMDTAGPMACGIEDLAILLQVITCPDPAEPGALPPPWAGLPDFTVNLHPEALRGRRIGIVRDWFRRSGEVLPVMENAIAAMKRCGAVVVDPVSVGRIEGIWRAEGTVLRCEFRHGIEEWLRGLPESRVRSLEDLVRFNDEHRDAELALFGQEAFVKALESGGLESPEYRAALEMVRTKPHEALEEPLRRDGLDMLCAISGGPAWPVDGPDRPSVSCSSLPAMAGWPHVSVPAGFVGGLPVGLSFISRPWTEADLLGWAYAWECESREFRPPALADAQP